MIPDLKNPITWQRARQNSIEIRSIEFRTYLLAMIEGAAKTQRWIIEGISGLFGSHSAYYQKNSWTSVLGNEAHSASLENVETATPKRVHRIEVPNGQIFETTLTLPKSARRTLARTIELQLDALSPLDPQSVDFAWYKLSCNNPDAINIAVVIARKTTIEEARGQLSPSAIWHEIAPERNDSKRSPFVFVRRFNKNRLGMIERYGGALILALGVLALLSGAQSHLQHRTDALAQQRASLIADLKTQTKHNQQLSSVLQDHLNRGHVISYKGLLTVLNTLPGRLPEQFTIESLSLERGVLQVGGYLPSTITAKPDDYYIERRASNRPGFDHATFKLSMGEGVIDD